MFRVFSIFEVSRLFKVEKKRKLFKQSSSFVVQIIGGGKEGTQRKRSRARALCRTGLRFLSVYSRESERKTEEEEEEEEEEVVFFLPEDKLFWKSSSRF